MTNEISILIDASEKVCQQIKLMVASEKEKRQALLRHESDKIDSLVQAQQAMSMKLDGLEKKRFAAQTACGFSGKTSTQILDLLDSETRKTAQPIFEELRFLAADLQDSNRASLSIVTAELRIMDHSPSAKEEVRGLYSADGKTGGYSPSGSAFQEKI